MKAVFSDYLNTIAPLMKELIAELRKRYDYVSILSTDTKGFSVNVSQRAKAVSNSAMFTERGNVVRVYKDGLYSEYSFNETDRTAGEIAQDLTVVLDAQMELLKATGTAVYNTAKLEDEPAEVFVEMETGIMPEDADFSAIIEELSDISDAGVKSGDNVLDCMVRASSTHVSKMFLSEHRDMRQSYVYSEGGVMPLVEQDGRTEMGYASVSGRRGPEIFHGLKDKLKDAVTAAEEVLAAEVETHHGGED